ncbi:hypothetical protein LCGC14_0078700 [marine sediment metagenome]|uniref:Glycosyltransferase RgtA/B/C/D-like domain-containing protein n=1 Tax=marine sediment metagenome TaxID=412755 RepID=A0A0F9VLV7_9ZZZZ|nr:DUF6427 family protein [Maribacter sp.]HDZ04464.1 hypothetical protein [Maribacter sp.]HEC39355.1 hypothetical protein [bacterium]
MISSIFEKTKPVNFIILLVFLFLFYWSVQFYLLDSTFSEVELLPSIGILTILLFSVFIVDFVVKRNKLTGSNSFAILFFTLLFVVFPETLGDNKAIFTSFFLLLAMRRLLSIKSLKNIKLKIFDAGLWICISSIFYEWALLYLLLVFAAIYIYEPKNIRNWLVIISVGVCFISILYGILILLDKPSFIQEHYDFAIDYDAIFPIKWWSSLKMSLFAILNTALAFSTFIHLSKSGVGKVIVMRLIAFSFILGLVVNILVTSDNNNAVMITFFPSVIFIVNYLESIKKPKFLELVLISSIVVPIIVFVTKL